MPADHPPDVWIDEPVLPDGSVVVTSNGSALTKLRSDGSVDMSFGSNGSVDVGIRLEKVGVAPSGRLVAIGEDTSQHLSIVRLLPSGQLDTSYGSGGTATFDRWLTPAGPAIDQSGRVLARVAVPRTDSGDAGLVRITPNGRPDTTFHGGQPLVLPG